MKYIKYLMAFALLSLLTGCDKTSDLSSNEQQISVRLTQAYSNIAQLAADEGEDMNTLKYFICDKGKVTLVSQELAGYDGLFKLDKKEITSTSKIYVIANHHLCDAASKINVGSSESVFASLETAQSGNNGQLESMAMSATSSLDEALNGKALFLQLKRNIARFDLNISPNVGIEILSLTAHGLATASSIFENGVANSENTASYIADFDAPITEPIKGLFYAHPRLKEGSAAMVELDVKYNGRLVTIEASLGDIKRNCIHNINISANLGTISVTVDVAGLEEGDSDNTQNNDLRLKIDKTASAVPEGVSISTDGMRLNLPFWGADATIALTAQPGVKLAKVEGAIDDFVIVPLSDDGLRYRITTSANARIGSDKKAVVLNFTLPNDPLGNLYRIVVPIDNYSSFPCAAIGNLEWMHYNASNDPLNDYPLFYEGADLRAMYSGFGGWARLKGKSYQWGPRPGRNGVQIILSSSSSESYGYQALPTINGNIIGNGNDKIWEGSTSPCPDGWRLPTYDEFQTIWPPNGTALKENVPTQYVTSKGNSLSAVIEAFGGTILCNTTGGNGGGAYLQVKNMIISDGNVEMIFPIGGVRAPNGTFRDDRGILVWTGLAVNVGIEGLYWCANKFNANYVAVGINKLVIQNNTSNRENNAWYHARCVRNKK